MFIRQGINKHVHEAVATPRTGSDNTALRSAQRGLRIHYLEAIFSNLVNIINHFNVPSAGTQDFLMDG